MQTDITLSLPTALQSWQEDADACRAVPVQRRRRPFLGLAGMAVGPSPDCPVDPDYVHRHGVRAFYPAQHFHWLTLMDFPAGHFRDPQLGRRIVRSLRRYRTRLQDGMPLVGGPLERPLRQWDFHFRPSADGGRDTLRPAQHYQEFVLGLELSDQLTRAAYRTCWRDLRAEPGSNGSKGPGWYQEYRQALQDLPEPYLVYGREELVQLAGELFTQPTTQTQRGRQVYRPTPLKQLPRIVSEAFLDAVGNGRLPFRAPASGTYTHVAPGADEESETEHWERDYRTGQLTISRQAAADHGGPALRRCVIWTGLKTKVEFVLPANLEWRVRPGERVQAGDILAYGAKPFSQWNSWSTEDKLHRLHKVLGSEKRAQELFLHWFFNQQLPLDNELVLIPSRLVGPVTKRARQCYLEVSDRFLAYGHELYRPIPLTGWGKGLLLDGHQLWRHGHPGQIAFHLDPAADPRFQLRSPARDNRRSQAHEQRSQQLAEVGDLLAQPVSG